LTPSPTRPPIFEEGEVVGILRVPLIDIAIEGTVPVAATIEGSTCSNNQRIVSPSDLWHNSLV
ncbi:uncharacterized protein LOC113305724, partial [Papaver somniferum]|uniref:uncharacterized protein LOC113305724 n=1 Tax=Papaver somniferum TaxID=3469 RepID=UPI000E6F58B5